MKRIFPLVGLCAVTSIMRMGSQVALAEPIEDAGWCPWPIPTYGDANRDGAVDLNDFSALRKCLDGPAVYPQVPLPLTPEICLAAFDSNHDNRIDLRDFRGFVACFPVSFSRDDFSLIFVSSERFSPNLGSLAAYDAQCNRLATRAGINNAEGNAFIALMSDSSADMRVRFIPANGGHVRTDGVPVAELLWDHIYWRNQILNPIRADETGEDVGYASVMTGTNLDGTSSGQTCGDWTGTGSVTTGNSTSGPEGWVGPSFEPCGQGPFHIYCTMTSEVGYFPAWRRRGKLAFLSKSYFIPGSGQTPDQRCQADKPPGTGPVRALVATSIHAAGELIDPEALYVRLDGQIVGRGNDLIELCELRSGIWQRPDGRYSPQDLVWTGHDRLDEPGTPASTCNDWASSTSTSGVFGVTSTTSLGWWWSAGEGACSRGRLIYCVEE